MSCLSITELPRAERQDMAIREVVRTCSLRLGILRSLASPSGGAA